MFHTRSVPAGKHSQSGQLAVESAADGHSSRRYIPNFPTLLESQILSAGETTRAPDTTRVCAPSSAKQRVGYFAFKANALVVDLAKIQRNYRSAGIAVDFGLLIPKRQREPERQTEARKYENSTALEDDDVRGGGEEEGGGCDTPGVRIAAKSPGRCVVGSCLMNGANLPIRNATLTAQRAAAATGQLVHRCKLI